MENKRKMIVISNLILSSLSICLIASSSSFHFSKGENSSYTFCFNNLTGDKYTNSSGYVVNIKTKNGVKENNNFRSLYSLGSIAITDGFNERETKGINGLTSICVDFSGGALTLSYGWKDGIYYASNIALTSGVSYDFNGDNPTYFRIDNVSTDETSNINSINGTYSCIKSQEKKQSENDWDYSIDGITHKIILTSYKGSQSFIIIPSSIGGTSVAKIDASCFSNVITWIKGIYIPNSLTAIPENLFAKATVMEKISFPYLGNSSSRGGRISYFFNDEIPSSLTNVEVRGGILIKEAFNGTSNITDVTLFGGESGIKEFNANAFWGCKGINNINIVEGNLIEASSNKYSCFSKDGVIYTTGSNNKNKIVCFPKGRTGEYIINSDVDTILGGDFGSFRNCQISSLIIHENVIEIGEASFDNCPNLLSFKVSSDNLNYSSDENGVLFNKDKTYLVTYPSGKDTNAYVVPEGVTTICKDAFAFSKVSEVTFHENSSYESTVTTFSDYAFYSCKSLKKIIIPKGITKIGKKCFYNCDSASTQIYIRYTETEFNSVTKGSGWNGSNCPVTYNYKGS